MHAVHFDKAFAEQVLDAIRTGQPLPAPPEGWTGAHLLTATGALFAAVLSQGPHNAQALGVPLAKLREMSPEYQDAINDTLEQDVHAAIDFVSMLAFKVMDNEYDAGFEAEVKAVVYQKGERGCVHPVSGLKNR